MKMFRLASVVQLCMLIFLPFHIEALESNYLSSRYTIEAMGTVEGAKEALEDGLLVEIPLNGRCFRVDWANLGLGYDFRYILKNAAPQVLDLLKFESCQFKARHDKSLIVTSLYRSYNYNQGLQKKGYSAVDNSCHIIGLCVDISKRNLTRTEEGWLSERFSFLGELGFVQVLDEGSHYHVRVSFSGYFDWAYHHYFNPCTMKFMSVSSQQLNELSVLQKEISRRLNECSASSRSRLVWNSEVGWIDVDSLEVIKDNAPMPVHVLVDLIAEDKIEMPSMQKMMDEEIETFEPRRVVPSHSNEVSVSSMAPSLLSKVVDSITKSIQIFFTREEVQSRVISLDGFDPDIKKSCVVAGLF